jgi:YHS domain-containing protein
MLGLLLRILLVYLVIRAVTRLAFGVSQGVRGWQPPQERPPVGLVRDPVCGTFVVPTRALTAGSGAAMHYFCSERCREAWNQR